MKPNRKYKGVKQAAAVQGKVREPPSERRTRAAGTEADAGQRPRPVISTTPKSQNPRKNARREHSTGILSCLKLLSPEASWWEAAELEKPVDIQRFFASTVHFAYGFIRISRESFMPMPLNSLLVYHFCMDDSTPLT